jgi:hypothetical protein
MLADLLVHLFGEIVVVVIALWLRDGWNDRER